ncbi:hypothetical protein L0B53_03605 [Vibrio sp. SS-MA-C1-2]|uniref:hypothetical protein n=1 Tax=Vibrio sp. SS-MA-C1-2 TaxID=2908646 RepID=UPI001F2AC4B5|nr:hypothetical protein [Vibrio sp. SS-MA-C1-2]UJF17036.1 hypothetical protein L0B53_03605 [Vibrio sp. SS-MA-C1-2]
MIYLYYLKKFRRLHGLCFILVVAMFYGLQLSQNQELAKGLNQDVISLSFAEGQVLPPVHQHLYSINEINQLFESKGNLLNHKLQNENIELSKKALQNLNLDIHKNSIKQKVFINDNSIFNLSILSIISYGLLQLIAVCSLGIIIKGEFNDIDDYYQARTTGNYQELLFNVVITHPITPTAIFCFFVFTHMF